MSETRDVEGLTSERVEVREAVHLPTWRAYPVDDAEYEGMKAELERKDAALRARTGALKELRAMEAEGRFTEGGDGVQRMKGIIDRALSSESEMEHGPFG